MGHNYFKFWGIFLLGMFFSFTTFAQWNSNLSENLLISEEGMIDQDLVMVSPAANGGAYVAWLSWEDSNYFLKLQLLDKNGNSCFSPGGMYVCKQPTPSWSSGYSFIVTSDNSAVFVSSDMRNDDWQAYAYKISSEGKHLWSSDGVAIMKSGEGSALNPKIMETKAGNFIVGYKSMGAGSSRLSFAKIKADGTIPWGGKLDIIGGGDLFDMVSSGDDGFIVSYFDANSYFAEKYNATGDKVWDGRAAIDDSETAKVTSEPCVVSDGEGGLVAAWRYAASAYTTGGKVQHLDANGNQTFTEEFATDNLPFISVNKEKKEIYVFSSDPVASSSFSPRVWKMDYTGRRLWDAAGIALSENGLSYAAYGIEMCGDDAIFVYRNGSEYNIATIEYARINKDGEFVLRNGVVSSAPGDKGRGEITPIVDGQFITAWTDNSSKAGGFIFAQNVEAKPTNIVSLENDAFDIRVLPITSGCLPVFVQSPTDLKVDISLMEMSGAMIADWGQITLSAGSNDFNCALGHIMPGVYLLSVKTSGTIRNIKVLVK